MRTSARHNPARSKRKPPRGMHLNYDDLVAIVTGPSGEGDTILRSMDSEIVSFKRQVFIFQISMKFFDTNLYYIAKNNRTLSILHILLNI